MKIEKVCIKKITATAGDGFTIGQVVLEFKASDEHGSIQDLADLQEAGGVSVNIDSLQQSLNL
ncbi:MAG: hypothetical protein ABGX83_05315 [Nitrospira sp.]